MSTNLNTWPVQDAKARFSEMLDSSVAEGPQVVTKHGKPAAVLVPIRQWEAMQQANKHSRSLKQLLLSPDAPRGLALPARGELRLRKATTAR